MCKKYKFFFAGKPLLRSLQCILMDVLFISIHLLSYKKIQIGCATGFLMEKEKIMEMRCRRGKWVTFGMLHCYSGEYTNRIFLGQFQYFFF